MPGVPAVVTITAPADPCGYVFAAENKAAGGTWLEWAHYRLCEASNWVGQTTGDLQLEVVSIFSSLWNRLTSLFTWAKTAAGQAGQWIARQAKAIHDEALALIKYIQDALGPALRSIGLTTFAGVLVVGLFAAYLFFGKNK